MNKDRVIIASLLYAFISNKFLPLKAWLAPTLAKKDNINVTTMFANAENNISFN